VVRKGKDLRGGARQIFSRRGHVVKEKALAILGSVHEKMERSGRRPQDKT